MFWKPAISDMENGIKKTFKQKNYTSQTGNWKRHFLQGCRKKNTAIGLDHLYLKKKKLFLYRYFKRPASFENLKKMPLADSFAKNASFFSRAP